MMVHARERAVASGREKRRRNARYEATQRRDGCPGELEEVRCVSTLWSEMGAEGGGVPVPTVRSAGLFVPAAALPIWTPT